VRRLFRERAEPCKPPLRLWVDGGGQERTMTGQAQLFIDALARLEGDSDVGPIASLFADGAEISNPLVAHDGEGQAGAAAFWRSYRATFETIRSEFRHVVEDGGTVFLEWVSVGSIGGRPVRYGGVSVLEGGEGGLTAFRAYFDPAPLNRAMITD
jgi:limonene-1,2-epoxide hydrolase